MECRQAFLADDLHPCTEYGEYEKSSKLAMPGGARQRSKQSMASAKQHMRHRISPEVYCISASSVSWVCEAMTRHSARLIARHALHALRSHRRSQLQPLAWPLPRSAAAPRRRPGGKAPAPPRGGGLGSQFRDRRIDDERATLWLSASEGRMSMSSRALRRRHSAFCTREPEAALILRFSSCSEAREATRTCHNSGPGEHLLAAALPASPRLPVRACPINGLPWQASLCSSHALHTLPEKDSAKRLF